MVILITIIHVIVCFFLIIVVLLQSGKSGDIAAAFGGMGSQTAFGPRGAATALSKATTWSTIIFMLTSITLSVMASSGWQQFRLGPARHHAVADQDAAGNASANASEVVVSRRSSGFSQDRS